MPEPIDRDDWGTAALLTVIEDIAYAWARNYPNQKIQTGDMSLQDGGPIYTHENCPPTPTGTDHAGHQKGTEVDLRYVRINNELGQLNLNNASDYQHLDLTRTQYLVQLFRSRADVIKIYIDSRIQITPDPVIEWGSDHFDHFHVCIADPDGEGN